MTWPWAIIICTFIVCLSALVGIQMIYDTRGERR